MAQQVFMQRFAKWHIWLAWLTGVPILLWTLTGLIMVIKPIEEVRGNHLRLPIAAESQILPTDTEFSITLPPDSEKPVRSVETLMQRGRVVTRITYLDDSIERFGEDGASLGPITEIEARQIVAQRIKGGDQLVSSTAFDSDSVPFDFRRPVAVWQVALQDGTHVYVGQLSGEIEAVRTSWWRTFDFMWGLHIMDLQTREDTSHPILILFAALGVIASAIGCVLMFRRRKARVNEG